MNEILNIMSKMRLAVGDVYRLNDFCRRDVDWEKFFQKAETHGVNGLVFFHLHRLGLLPRLPADVARSFENRYRRTVENNLCLLAEAMRLSARCHQDHLEIIVMQGLAVLSVYTDIGMRPMADMDLLIQPDDRPTFYRLLAECGYHPLPFYPDVFEKNGILIDCHTHPVNLERIAARRWLISEYTQRLRTGLTPFFSFDGNGFFCPEPFDLFVFLCLHAVKHGFSRRIWLVDLHEFVLRFCLQTGANKNEDTGWDRLMAASVKWGQRRPVLQSLLLIEKVFALPVPSRVKQKLGAVGLGHLEKRIIGWIAAGVVIPELGVVLQGLAVAGAGNKMRFFRESLFPRPEIMAQICGRDISQLRKRDYIKRGVQVLKWVRNLLFEIGRLFLKR